MRYLKLIVVDEACYLYCMMDTRFNMIYEKEAHMQKSLNLVRQVISQVQNQDVTCVTAEPYNSEYESLTFLINNISVRSRLAKKTPTKAGYFVVAWEKDNHDNNKPFDYQDSPDLLMITVIDNDKKGQFIFPKDILENKKILRSPTSKGKMAFRVYPTWVNTLNKTALNTQRWQQEYFIDLSTDMATDKIKKLLYLY